MAIQRRRARRFLILVMGVAASGKSTLSRKILQRIRAVYLDNNHIADAFFPNTRNGGRYARLRPSFYSTLYRIAEENLKCGNSVLLDVPHIKDVQTSEWPGSIKKLARRTKTTLVTIRCVCSEKVLHARISGRGELRDEWKLKHWKQFLTQEPIRVAIPFRHLDVDTEGSLPHNVNTAISYIKRHLASWSS